MNGKKYCRIKKNKLYHVFIFRQLGSWGGKKPSSRHSMYLAFRMYNYWILSFPQLFNLCYYDFSLNFPQFLIKKHSYVLSHC